MRWVLPVVLLSACMAEVGGLSPDGGDAVDAGGGAGGGAAEPDAGQGGGAAQVDAGLDAGSDAGVSEDAGTSGDAGAPFDAGVTVDAGTTPVFVIVGYQGLRQRSTDLGLTWSPVQTLGADGDNEFLLRAVTWGHGLFVAVGWKIETSPDGVTWTERPNAQHQWLGAVQWKGDAQVFSAVGGYGYSAWSADGLTWTASTFRDAEAARSMAQQGDTLMAATDPGNWWRSTDGKTWVKDSAGHGSADIVTCDGQFTTGSACTQTVPAGDVAFGHGVWVRANWTSVERSTDGTTWTRVLTAQAGITGVAFAELP